MLVIGFQKSFVVTVIPIHIHTSTQSVSLGRLCTSLLEKGKCNIKTFRRAT